MQARLTTRFVRPLRDFLKSEATSGALLLVATAIALFWANSPWQASYATFWNTPATVQIGGHVFEMTFREVVNDGLLTLFFFVVGLEIKRELVEGELREWRQAMLPVIASIGGMFVPATIYIACNISNTSMRGWGIPVATDIALASGMLALFASRAHPSLRLFLLSLAIVDDIGAIVIIALFYSKGVHHTPLIIGIGVLSMMLILKRFNVRAIWIFSLCGITFWFFIHESGVHATLAGVILGLFAPTHPHLSSDLIDEDELKDVSTVEAARETVRIARESISVVEWLEHKLHPLTSYIIVPIFALANAGITMRNDYIRDALSSPITIGVILGLVVGKFVGVVGVAAIACRLKLAKLPDGVTWRAIMGAGTFAGIGFTVSIFIAELAFEDSRQAFDAIVGILVASLVSAIAGGLIMRSLPKIARNVGHSRSIEQM